MARYAVAGSADIQVVAGPTELHGYSVACLVAPALVTLHDGTSAAGPTIVYQEFAAAGSQQVLLPSIDIATGIWVEQTGGATTTTVYHS